MILPPVDEPCLERLPGNPVYECPSTTEDTGEVRGAVVAGGDARAPPRAPLKYRVPPQSLDCRAPQENAARKFPPAWVLTGPSRDSEPAAVPIRPPARGCSAPGLKNLPAAGPSGRPDATAPHREQH